MFFINELPFANRLIIKALVPDFKSYMDSTGIDFTIKH